MNENIDIWYGLAQLYDAYRPHAPEGVLDILMQLAQTLQPYLIVDLGSGTGLSTWVWLKRASQIVGIEPNDDMRKQAEARTASLDLEHVIEYRSRLCTDTGLPDNSANIITCSQALHWMEPESTFREIN